MRYNIITNALENGASKILFSRVSTTVLISERIYGIGSIVPKIYYPYIETLKLYLFITSQSIQ